MSSASTRSGDPANVTWTPRRLNSSATASAGSTCPAVPPAAIRHLSCLSSATCRDVKEDPDRNELHYEAGAAVGDERQRNSRQRSKPEDGGEVDRGLAADERREPRSKALAERVAALQRGLEARPREEDVREDQRRGSEQAELLADDGEDHVGVRLRQEMDLLHALPQPVADEMTRAEADLRLDDLEARSLRVLPRVEEAEQARTHVRARQDHQQPADAQQRD